MAVLGQDWCRVIQVPSVRRGSLVEVLPLGLGLFGTSEVLE